MTSSHRQKAVSSAGSRRADAGDSPPNLEAASSAAAATSAAPPPEAAASRAAAAAASAARKGSGGGAPSTAWARDAAMGDLGRMTRSCFGALRPVGAAPALQPAHTFPPGTAPDAHKGGSNRLLLRGDDAPGRMQAAHGSAHGCGAARCGHPESRGSLARRGSTRRRRTACSWEPPPVLRTLPIRSSANTALRCEGVWWSGVTSTARSILRCIL